MTTTIRRYAALPVALSLAGALLVGCNGGDEPTSSPTPTTSSASPSATSSSPPASPTASPSPSVSIPAEAMAQTPEGAVAFVKFYFDQVNKAYMAPDNTLLRDLGEADCKSCAALQANADEYVSLRHRYTTPGVAVSDVVAQDGAPGDEQFVAFTLQQLEANVVDSNGGVVSTKKAVTVPRKALLRWKGSAWAVVDIG